MNDIAETTDTDVPALLRNAPSSVEFKKLRKRLVQNEREAVEIATADQEAALAAYGQAAINAFSELETSLDQGVVIQQRIVDLKEAAAEAGNAFKIAQLRYEEAGDETEGKLLETESKLMALSSKFVQAENEL